jgi:CHAT domain
MGENDDLNMQNSRLGGSALVRSSANSTSLLSYSRLQSDEIRRHRASPVLQLQSCNTTVLDAHGRYDAAGDELAIEMLGSPVSVEDLLPDALMPPLWILSSCSTSVTGARHGCLVRHLLSKGAVCVVATLGPVDAFIASMFVGRLLTNIFSPATPGAFSSFAQLFFGTQLTTAVLYDPLLPLIRRSDKDERLREALGGVLGEYLAWEDGGKLSAHEYRHKAAYRLAIAMERHGVATQYNNALQAGLVRPETLLFTAFGFPGMIAIGSEAIR